MNTIITWFQETLLPYGAPGLFALSFLDATFVPMPQLFDIAVMVAITVEPGDAVPFTAAVTAGSTIGTLLIFGLARAGRARFVGERTEQRLESAERIVNRYGLPGVMLAATLPAPFPFKYVVIAAGLLKQRTASFGLAVLLGRAVRFTTQAVIAVQFGDDIIGLFDRYALPATLGLIALWDASIGLPDRS